MDEHISNYYALLISIIACKSVEKSLMAMFNVERPKRYRRKYTDEERQEIKDLYNNGMPMNEISKELGINYNTIYSMIVLQNKDN